MRWLCCLVLAACAAEPPAVPPEPITSKVLYWELPLHGAASVDLLFVIDNSPAMAPYQSKLAATYRQLATIIESGFVPNLHVGVITTDVADGGRLTGPFLSDAVEFDGSRTRSYNGSLAEALFALANVGTAGSPHTEPLEAIHRALDPTINPGFIRGTAYLMVVVITANDDMSEGPFDSYVRALKELKADPKDVVVAGAFGPCDRDGLTATPAPRLGLLFDQFPDRNTRAPICDADLGGVLALLPQIQKITLNSYCGDEPLLDREPELDGVQPECSATLVNHTTHQERVIGTCTSDRDSPCWQMVEDPIQCVYGQHLRVRMQPDITAIDTFLVLECAAE